MTKLKDLESLHLDRRRGGIYNNTGKVDVEIVGLAIIDDFACYHGFYIPEGADAYYINEDYRRDINTSYPIVFLRKKK
ncbi:hypothetical protein M0R19_00595 [Candidatus Pacearchaeota archaeon]|jgi:hypothetical protein|nr:hypothetical protein [Candidatus Pacearchaeota archaeon]